MAGRPNNDLLEGVLNARAARSLVFGSLISTVAAVPVAMLLVATIGPMLFGFGLLVALFGALVALSVPAGLAFVAAWLSRRQVPQDALDLKDLRYIRRTQQFAGALALLWFGVLACSLVVFSARS